MKKLLCLLLATLLLVCLCACGDIVDSIKNNGDKNNTTTTTAADDDADATTTTTTTTAAPLTEAQLLIGTWEASVNIAEVFNEMMAMQLAEVADYFKADELLITLCSTFKTDGTYVTSIKQNVVDTFVQNVKTLLSDGFSAYFNGLIKETELNITIDELLALDGTTFEAFLDDIFAQMDLESMLSSFTAEGQYKILGDKLFSSSSLTEAINEALYETFTVTETTLTLLSVVGEEMLEDLYPIIFTRVTE